MDITKENYHNIDVLISNETETLQKQETDYQTEKEKLEKMDNSLSGTVLVSLSWPSACICRGGRGRRDCRGDFGFRG